MQAPHLVPIGSLCDLAKPVAAAVMLALAAGCASSPEGGGAGREYPGVLRAPEAMVQDVVWRQRVTASWPDGERGFDAAVQKNGDTLTVIGLSPMGAMGFVFSLTGGEIEFTNNSGQELPFPPRYILLDVQRVFYPWLEGYGLRGGRADGHHTGEVDGEMVVEQWLDGRIVQRQFVRLDGEPQGAVTVDYEWGPSPSGTTGNGLWAAPAKAVLENAWFGYTLTVETSEETLLPVGS